jgi:hypothetical protein
MYYSDTLMFLSDTKTIMVCLLEKRSKLPFHKNNLYNDIQIVIDYTSRLENSINFKASINPTYEGQTK